jgi:KUP system potassium uptake protein
MLYGEGMITPAISVLAAVEGLQVETPFFEPYVVPIAVVILLLLFVLQQFGTHRVGGLFGPVMLLWFLTIGFRDRLDCARACRARRTQSVSRGSLLSPSMASPGSSCSEPSCSR